MNPQADFETEAQDRAETLDETNLTEDGDKPSDLEDEDADRGVDSEADPHVDRQLDKGLKETFPASDPVSINPGAD